jgi:hypothetical protein
MWPTAPGTTDPIFLCELALELKMPVGELCSRMSLHELTVVWPAYFAYRERERTRQENREKEQARMHGGRR